MSKINKNEPKKKRRSRKSRAKNQASNKAPLAINSRVVTIPNPKIQTKGNHTQVQHTEYFKTMLPATSTYTVSSLPCNPGTSGIFPWLSQIAQRYETYKFRQLEFEYHPLCPATFGGVFGMVFDFDTNDPAPATRMEAMSYHDKASSCVWAPVKMRLDLAQGDRLPSKYTRPGHLENEDMKTYDIGRLHLFTEGTNGSALGDVSVSYVIDLYTPQTGKPVGGEYLSTKGLQPLSLIGTDFTPDPNAVGMLTPTSSSVLTFDQNWEGVVNMVVEGVDIPGGLGFGASVRKSRIHDNYMSADGTKASLSYDISAVAGDFLKPYVGSVGSTILTKVLWSFGSMAFPSLL